MNNIPDPDRERILECIDFVSLYVGDCDDWVTIKKQIMRGIPSSLRTNFSTRDPITKEQNLNQFEKTVINYYKNLTGVNLVLRTLQERRDLEYVF